jgi:hypothetical protein
MRRVFVAVWAFVAILLWNVFANHFASVVVAGLLTLVPFVAAPPITRGLAAVWSRRPRRRRDARPWYAPRTGLLLKWCGVAVFVAALYARVAVPWPRRTEQLVYLLYLPAVFLVVVGDRLRRKAPPEVSLDACTGAVLWLRPFEQDTHLTYNPVTLGSALGIEPIPAFRGFGPLANVHPLRIIRVLLGRHTDTAEEQLAAALAPEYRTIALGRPGELLRLTGAERFYAPDAIWHEQIATAMDRARLLVLQLGTGSGLNWEIEQCLRHHREKTVISTAGCEPKLVAAVLDSYAVRTPVEAVAVALFIGFTQHSEPMAIPAMFRSPFVWPVRGCAVHLRATLAPVLPDLKVSSAEKALNPWVNLSAVRFAVLGWAALSILGLVATSLAFDLVWPFGRIAECEYARYTRTGDDLTSESRVRVTLARGWTRSLMLLPDSSALGGVPRLADSAAEIESCAVLYVGSPDDERAVLGSRRTVLSPPRPTSIGGAPCTERRGAIVQDDQSGDVSVPFIRWDCRIGANDVSLYGFAADLPFDYGLSLLRSAVTSIAPASVSP